MDAKCKNMAYARSLSDFGIVGCECAAAAHFLPSSCPIVPLWGGESGKNWSRWGAFSLSTPKVRQAPSVVFDAGCDKLNRWIFGLGKAQTAAIPPGIARICNAARAEMTRFYVADTVEHCTSNQPLLSHLSHGEKPQRILVD